MTASYNSTAPAARTPRPWTQEEVEIALELRAAGWSYSKIGKALDRHRVSVYDKLNPEKKKEYGYRWRKNNPERGKEVSRRWRENNPEKAKANVYRWRGKNPEKKREHERRRSALKRNCRKVALTKVTLDAKAKRFTFFGDACAYCGLKPSRLTEDHVLALTAGGLDELSNLAPACVSCNSSKGSKLVEVWYKSQPFFCEARWELIKKHCPGASGQLSLAIPT